MRVLIPVLLVFGLLAGAGSAQQAGVQGPGRAMMPDRLVDLYYMQIDRISANQEKIAKLVGPVLTNRQEYPNTFCEGEKAGAKAGFYQDEKDRLALEMIQKEVPPSAYQVYFFLITKFRQDRPEQLAACDLRAGSRFGRYPQGRAPGNWRH
jgi:hypothetical protein